jgi:hypothetical protein
VSVSRETVMPKLGPWVWEIVDSAETPSEAYLAYGLAEAWGEWRKASCVEALGEHRWLLVVEEGSASLRCENPECPADVNDVYPDGWEFLAIEVPVTVAVETIEHRGGPWGPTEYDVNIYLEQR